MTIDVKLNMYIETTVNALMTYPFPPHLFSVIKYCLNLKYDYALKYC